MVSLPLFPLLFPPGFFLLFLHSSLITTYTVFISFLSFFFACAFPSYRLECCCSILLSPPFFLCEWRKAPCSGPVGEIRQLLVLVSLFENENEP
jgi:hypothetical protein